MWNARKQKQLDKLRQREMEGSLTTAEMRQLQKLFAELDQEEAVALNPHFTTAGQESARVQKELSRLIEKNRKLEQTARQQERLLKEAWAVLSGLQKKTRRTKTSSREGHHNRVSTDSGSVTARKRKVA